MIKPTIGRVMWYRPVGSNPDDQPLPALVCHVNSDETVNLVVFDALGTPTADGNVPVYQGEGDRPTESAYAEWMPYQLGQAAKTEAVLAGQKQNEQKPQQPKQ